MMAGCKRWVKKGLVTSRVLSLWQRLLSSRVIILRYHSVQNNPDADTPIGRGIVHRAEDFAQQMRWLSENYQPVTLDQVSEALHVGRSLPSRGVLITFDDGYQDNYSVAMPILNQYGMTGVFYITVDCVDQQKLPWFCRLRHAFAAARRPDWQGLTGTTWQLGDEAQRGQAYAEAAGKCAGLAGAAQEDFLTQIEGALDAPPFAPAERLMMTWDEVRELHRQGHTVGSHTLSHPNVAQARPEDQTRELVESKRRLEEELGVAVRHFSYPSPRLQPHWTEATVASCAEAGYETAVTTTPGPTLTTDPLLALKRFPVPEAMDAFKWTVQCAFLGHYA